FVGLLLVQAGRATGVGADLRIRDEVLVHVRRLVAASLVHLEAGPQDIGVGVPEVDQQRGGVGVLVRRSVWNAREYRHLPAYADVLRPDGSAVVTDQGYFLAVVVGRVPACGEQD